MTTVQEIQDWLNGELARIEVELKQAFIDEKQDKIDALFLEQQEVTARAFELMQEAEDYQSAMKSLRKLGGPGVATAERRRAVLSAADVLGQVAFTGKLFRTLGRHAVSEPNKPLRATEAFATFMAGKPADALLLPEVQPAFDQVSGSRVLRAAPEPAKTAKPGRSAAKKADSKNAAPRKVAAKRGLDKDGSRPRRAG